jgi:hypothetical protein
MRDYTHPGCRAKIGIVTWLVCAAKEHDPRGICMHELSDATATAAGCQKVREEKRVCARVCGALAFIRFANIAPPHVTMSPFLLFLAYSMPALAPGLEAATLLVTVDAQDILARITGNLNRAQIEGNSSRQVLAPFNAPWCARPVSSLLFLPLCHPFRGLSNASRLDEAWGRHEKRVPSSCRLSDIARATGVRPRISIVPRSFRCHARTTVKIRIFRVACDFFAPSGRS